MPTLSFSEDEIEADISSQVNPAGLAYVGRKHKGKKVRILVMKGSGHYRTPLELLPEVTDTPHSACGLKSEASREDAWG